jgi:hypothetical protein
MYCSKCGSLMDDKLNYCKNCGAKLPKNEDEGTPKSMLDDVLTSLCVIVIFGLGILVGLVAVLLEKLVTHQIVIFIVLGYLAGLFSICFMLLKQVPKLIDARLNAKPERSEITQPAQLKSPTTAQLEEHREPVLSVTENTTRTFDKIQLKEN